MRNPNETKTQLLSLKQFPMDVVHDLRGPLAGIGMLATVAEQHLQRGDYAAAREGLRRIASQAQMSQSVLDALWRLADRLDLPLELSVCALDALARAAADEAVLSVQAQRPEGRVPDLDLQPLGDARVDRGLLHVILVNLIGNAVKFNLDQESVVVRVSRDNGSDGADLVLLVNDDGAGFDLDSMGQTPGGSEGFRPSDSLPGYGLGLSIVRRATGRLGGRVEVQSVRGRGTTARVTIPQV